MLHIHENSNLILGTQIGTGAFAEVFKGKYKDSDLAVAVKKRLDPARSFTREAELIAALTQHPNVISVITRYVDGYSMTLVEGMELNHHLIRYLPEFDHRLQISQGILKGVMHLHKANVTHADLKPQNIMVTREGHPVICDLGLAKLHTEALVLSKPSGTPRYMAPEMMSQFYLTKAVDLYALGLIFWTLQSGIEPFDEDQTALELVEKVLRHVRPDLQDLPFQCLAFTLVIFYLWRPEPVYRIPLAHALEIVEGIIADLNVQLNETSIVKTIASFKFFKCPIKVLFHAMRDGNQVVMSKIINDPHFSMDGLNKPYSRQLFLLAALRNGQSAIVLKLLDRPDITKQHLMMVDELSQNGLLATALKMNAIDVFETILANPYCDAEVYSSLFISVDRLRNEFEKNPEWLAIAVMSKAMLSTKNISQDYQDAIRSVFTHPLCIARNLSILGQFKHIPQDSLLWESNFVKAYLHLHEFAKLTRNLIIKVVLQSSLNATDFCKKIVEEIQHYDSVKKMDSKSVGYISFRKAVAVAELHLKSLVDVSAAAPQVLAPRQ